MTSRQNDPPPERPERRRRPHQRPQTTPVIERIRAKLRKAPVIDDRSPEEIIGYDANGLPK